MSSLIVHDIETNQDISISDGMWVAKVTAGGVGEWFYEILGRLDNRYTTQKETQESEVLGSEEYTNHLLVASQPFAVMTTHFSGMCLFPPILESVARQVVDGKPRKRLSVNHPHFVRGAKNWRWAKLSELASLVGLSDEMIWRRYFRAANQKGATFMDDGEDILTAVADSPASEPFAINFERHRNPCRLYKLNPDDSFFHWELNPTFEQIIEHFQLDVPPMELQRLWVPAGWAQNVCCLEKLGYQTPEERYQAYQASEQSESV